MLRKSIAIVGCVASLAILGVSGWTHREFILGPEPASGTDSDPVVLAQQTGDPQATPGTPGRRRALSLDEQFDLTGLSIPREQLLNGGPGKDGIPSITNPQTVPVAKADFLRPTDRVIGVTLNGQSRAYPIRLLNWHEAINDQLGGTPILVVYCPLCDSVSVLDRRIEDEVLEFGVSGLLYNSNVLLYDRKHNALWSQLGFQAISGPQVGRSLKHLPWELTTFGQWKPSHPDGSVTTFNAEQWRDYLINPYEEYYQTPDLMFPVSSSDERLPNKESVVGVQFGEIARAYPVKVIAAAPNGRLVDQIGDGRLVLEMAGDQQGVRVLEAPAGAKIVHTFWFAWAAFHPRTELR